MCTEIGDIGEAAAKLDLLKKGFEIYDGNGGSYFDFIAVSRKTKEPKRVEVKTTRCRNEADTGWLVRIGKSRSKGTAAQPFDSTNVDILVVYIEPLDQLIYYKGSDIKYKHKFTIMDSKESNNVKSFDIK